MKSYESVNIELKHYFNSVSKVLKKVSRGKYKKAVKRLEAVNSKFSDLEKRLINEYGEEGVVERFKQVYNEMKDIQYLSKSKEKLRVGNDVLLGVCSGFSIFSIITGYALNTPEVAGIGGAGCGVLTLFILLLKYIAVSESRDYRADTIVKRVKNLI